MPDGEHEFRIVFARPFEHDKVRGPYGTVPALAFVLYLVILMLLHVSRELTIGSLSNSTIASAAITAVCIFWPVPRSGINGIR
jgi:hypothetical protein